ncbi:hypothetical protein [Actinomadura harenae]|uniref:PH domain-containing protein n=1 Tax=Actinomadura harenae TaxID=2483351 RepID=A0A3M2M0Y7_9ACTN|nr:hypothetical protein [Actinomadura harenae]RMI42553.1 hypothetical protein EBO15_19125 [Actinomadura harenae]
MSDQASELRARWRALSPSLRVQIIRTGRTSEPEAQWIAVNFARMELGRVRRRIWTALAVHVVVLGTLLGVLRSVGVVGGTSTAVVAAVVSVPVVLALFAWGRGRMIAFSRILTLNASSAPDSAPVAVAPRRGERLDVRLVLGRVVVRFGAIALVLALVGAVMAALKGGMSATVVCEGAAGVILLLLLWVVVRARKVNPIMTLSESGVTVGFWKTTVPWERITGISVVPLNGRGGSGGSYVLALTVDAPERFVAGLSGTYARNAQRSASAYGTPLTFDDRYTDTSAHAVASAVSAWTGLPVRST